MIRPSQQNSPSSSCFFSALLLWITCACLCCASIGARALAAAPPAQKSKAAPAARSQAGSQSYGRSLLEITGMLTRPVKEAEVASWKQELHQPGITRERAGWLHLWLGEWQLAANKQPETAMAHFEEAAKRARPDERLAGYAALDCAFATYYEGAYSAAAEAFHRLLMPETAHPGYDPRLAAMWYRRAGACAGYHAQRAKLGINEPPRLDPLCGAAGLAACLRSLGLPYNKKTVLSACYMNGEGSTVEDIVAAGRKLGVSVYKVAADDTGLMALPKPLIAYVEHDHFIAVTRADKAGVSYLCSDCGAWPGGRNDLTWKQWHAMEGGPYLAVVRKGSIEDRQLASLPTVGALPAGRTKQPVKLWFHRRFYRRQSLFLRLYPHVAVIRSLLYIGCIHPCTFPVCCPQDSGSPPSGTDDPVNLATGEEEYRPDDDLIVYNPGGPSVHWGRTYNSMRAVGDGFVSNNPAYQYNDFGAGWTQHYNVGVYDSSGGGTGGKAVFSENGAATSFTAPSVPTAANPRVVCTVQPGSPMLVEWDYDPNNSYGYYTITFADRTQWITTSLIPSINCCALAQIRDRMGNTIYFNYAPAPTGFNWPLLSSISTGPNATGTILLAIRRSADGTGSIVSVTDVVGGRSVYYNVQTYEDYYGKSPNATYPDLQSVSQVVDSKATSVPVRYSYGYQLLSSAGYPTQLRVLHTITVPSPAGSGTSTAYIYYTPNTDYVSYIEDANGNKHFYSVVDSNHTQVTVQNAKGVTVNSYTVGFDSNMSQTTLTNGAGQVVYSRTFGDANDPYRPSAITDGNGNTTSYTWDPFGHVLTEQKPSPRNTVTTYDYDYSVFPLGELKSVQEGVKSPTSYQYYEPSGLIKQITTPLPGTTGSNSTVTYAFTWDNLGNPLTITTPGNNATSSITTTFAYGSPAAINEPLSIADNLGKAVSFSYDPLGRVSSYTDQLNHTTEYGYNLAGQVDSIIYPATGETGTGQSSQVYTYQYPGGPLDTVTTYDESDKAVRQVNYKYGLEGELLSRSGSTEPVTYTYDGLYRVLTLADGGGHKTTYAYNPAGYLASIKYPKGDTTKFTKYDPLGNVLTRVDGRNLATNYRFNDPENLLTNITYPADTGHNVTFGYDAYGRRSGISDGTGVQIISYDDNDLTTSVQTTYNGLPSQVIAYGYYPNASRQSMTTPAGTFAYLYDGNGLLHSLTNPFNETTTWQPTDNRLVGKVTLPNGVTSTYGYDSRNRMSSLVNATSGGSVLSSFTNMLYDAANNRTSMTANDGLTTYSYVTGSSASANKDELAKEQSARAGGYTESFAYDAAFNPTTFRGATNTFNTDNQFTNSGYLYDGSGNPTTYQGATLAFDEENRLTGVGTSFAADYRGDGLRAWKQGAGGRTYFLYDGTFPVCELDASGNMLVVNTTVLNQVISRRILTGNTFYAFDPQGNVAQKLDANGNVFSSNEYDAFWYR